MTSSVAPSTIVPDTGKLKVHPPDLYYGDRDKLDTFLLQCELNIRFNLNAAVGDSDKVLFASTYLRDRAAEWLEPFLKDWLFSAPGARNVDTEAIFNSYDTFRQRIGMMFGELNEQHKAQMALDTIRQRGSAANYTAEFQRIAFHTGYDAAALCASYYKGLKSEVKDDMARGDMPT